MILIIMFILAFLFLIILTGIEIVKENTVYVIESFGKFSRIMTAGLNFRIPIIEEVAETVSLKQKNFSGTGRYHTKEKAPIDVATNIIYEVIPTEEAIKKYIYSLEEREKSFATTIENSLRTSFARESYDDVLAKKEAVINEVWKDLDLQFKKWGINIVSFQITGVHSGTAF